MYGIQGYSVAGTLSQLRSVVKPRGPLMWPDLISVLVWSILSVAL